MVWDDSGPADIKKPGYLTVRLTPRSKFSQIPLVRLEGSTPLPLLWSARLLNIGFLCRLFSILDTKIQLNSSSWGLMHVNEPAHCPRVWGPMTSQMIKLRWQSRFTSQGPPHSSPAALAHSWGNEQIIWDVLLLLFLFKNSKWLFGSATDTKRSYSRRTSFTP